jgi:hypothetical protein
VRKKTPLLPLGRDLELQFQLEVFVDAVGVNHPAAALARAVERTVLHHPRAVHTCDRPAFEALAVEKQPPAVLYLLFTQLIRLL